MEMVKDMIGLPNALIMADATKMFFRCMDGRNQEIGLFTPGGDFGEFLLGLHVYEGILGRKMEQDMVSKILEAYLGWMGQQRFYMCTDDEAIQHIEKELGFTMTMESLSNPNYGTFTQKSSGSSSSSCS